MSTTGSRATSHSETNTQVKGVSIVNVRGKEKRFGRFMGRRKSWKKAYVTLQSGQEINFAEGETK